MSGKIFFNITLFIKSSILSLTSLVDNCKFMISDERAVSKVEEEDVPLVSLLQKDGFIQS